MFEEPLVVASAASAFNNFAVSAPAFLWNAILCVPLFVGIYMFIHYFSDKIGIGPYVTPERMTFWTIVLTTAWVVLMGGNYTVLRDNVSVLPWVTAAILFVSAMIVGMCTRSVKFPIWYGRKTVSGRQRWIVNIAVIALCMVPVWASGMINWGGGLVQVAALGVGFLFGRHAKFNFAVVPWTLGIMFATTVAVLMQPELWRFGQLGNLGSVHLVWMLVTGIGMAAAMAANVVNPRGRIHASAYIKLKWLMRITSILCMLLFVLTEAVPIFIVSVIVAFISCAMSMWHATDVPKEFPLYMLAWAIILFGILIACPTITVIGIVWIALPGHGGRGGLGVLL